MDAADQSNGSATRNEAISHARLSSFRPKFGQMAEIRPRAGHADTPTRRGCTPDGRAWSLAVLRELIKARGRPLSRIELLDRAWGEEDLEVSERAVDNVILRLRRKLPEPDVIETVRSVGFRLASP